MLIYIVKFFHKYNKLLFVFANKNPLPKSHSFILNYPLSPSNYLSLNPQITTLLSYSPLYLLIHLSNKLINSPSPLTNHFTPLNANNFSLILINLLLYKIYLKPYSTKLIGELYFFTRRRNLKQFLTNLHTLKKNIFKNYFNFFLIKYFFNLTEKFIILFNYSKRIKTKNIS